MYWLVFLKLTRKQKYVWTPINTLSLPFYLEMPCICVSKYLIYITTFCKINEQVKNISLPRMTSTWIIIGRDILWQGGGAFVQFQATNTIFWVQATFIERNWSNFNMLYRQKMKIRHRRFVFFTRFRRISTKIFSKLSEMLKKTRNRRWRICTSCHPIFRFNTSYQIC